MKITRENLKNIVREAMVEESAYQEFFKKALEKTGKSIPQMSDEEKKAFFNKIDSAWKGKGEKKESVEEIEEEAVVVSKRTPSGNIVSKLKEESINEGKKRFYQRDGIGKAKYTISYHDGKSKHKDGSDFYGIQIFKNKKELEEFRSELLKKGYREDSGMKKESVNESINELANAETVDALTAIIGAGGVVGGALALDKLMTALERGKMGSKGKTVAKALRGLGKTFAGAGMKGESTNEELTDAQKKLPPALQKAIEKKDGKEESVNESSMEIKKLEDAIKMFQDKIKKQGRITNARDEEHLSALIKVYKQMGGTKIKESTNERMGSDKGAVGNANFNNRLKAMRDDKNSVVVYIDTNKGKKLLKVFKTQQTAQQFKKKNMDKLLNTKDVESVGTMPKKEWDSKEAKYAIESVNEAKTYTPKQVKQALEKMVKQLKVKWKQKGGYENFGQKELRKFKDTFGYSPYGSSDEREISDLIDSFEDWAMDYSDV